jgi:TonB family protein
MRTVDIPRRVAHSLAAVILAAGASGAAATEDFAPAAEGTGAQLAAAATAMSAPQLAAVSFDAGSPGLGGYKSEIARRIAAANRDHHTVDLPPILKSVVVLDISVDRRGRPVRVAVWRSNGYEDLEARALESVKGAGALPPPAEALLAGGDTVRFLETFLFRPDGRFQIRSLEPVVMPVGGTGVARR